MTDIELDELAARLGELTVLDVRRPEEYSGLFGAHCDPRQGHIPGAIHLDLEELMTLSEEEILECVGPVDGAEVVAYCHSGGRSAMAVRILGMVGYHARNYRGSWHEWSRTDLPLEAEGTP